MKDCIEGPLLYEEITKTLNDCKNGKSPGSDGFSYEFYKFFSVDLQWFLLRSLNFAYELGQLSVTQRNGVITLLPKGDKPRQLLKKLAAHYFVEYFIQNCLCLYRRQTESVPPSYYS